MHSSRQRRWNRWPRLFALAALALASGCARVAPYERETLARRDMTLAAGSDLSAGEQHAREYREGSSGGAAPSGGGCGCN